MVIGIKDELKRRETTRRGQIEQMTIPLAWTGTPIIYILPNMPNAE